VPPSLQQLQQQPITAPLLSDIPTPPPPQQQQSHFPSEPAAAQNGSVEQPSSSDFGDICQTSLRMKDSSEQQQQGQAKVSKTIRFISNTNHLKHFSPNQTQPPPVPVTTTGMQVQMQPSSAIDQQPAKLVSHSNKSYFLFPNFPLPAVRAKHQPQFPNDKAHGPTAAGSSARSRATHNSSDCGNIFMDF
jgi:hypothetical protein